MSPITPANRQSELWSSLNQLEACRNPTLRWILLGFEEKFEQKIFAVKNTWNQKIRSFYREVLSLNTRESPLQVTWLLDDNGAFIELIETRYPDLDFERLVAFRRYLSEVGRVQNYFDDLVAQEALTQTREYVAESLKAYDLKDIVKTLFRFYQRCPGSDIFGRYYLKKHSIEIYIVPCIVFSMLIEEDFLDMAIGTLAHELAHGFHHVGADKDGFAWDRFGLVESALVEGLAEFYTREFCRGVQGTRPQVLRAFNKTANYLPDEYRRYEQWNEGHGLETIYQAFIEARRNDVKSFEEFGRYLTMSAKRLGEQP